MNTISISSKQNLLCEQLYPDDVITIYDGIYDMAMVSGECTIAIWVFGSNEWTFVSEFSRSEIHSALQLFNTIKKNRIPDIYGQMDSEHPFCECEITDRIYLGDVLPF